MVDKAPAFPVAEQTTPSVRAIWFHAAGGANIISRKRPTGFRQFGYGLISRRVPIRPGANRGHVRGLRWMRISHGVLPYRTNHAPEGTPP